MKNVATWAMGTRPGQWLAGQASQLWKGAKDVAAKLWNSLPGYPGEVNSGLNPGNFFKLLSYLRVRLQVRINNAQGAYGEELMEEILEGSQLVGTQVEFKVPRLPGSRWKSNIRKMDFLIERANGTLEGIELKTGAARYNSVQQQKDLVLVKVGGIIIGGVRPGFGHMIGSHRVLEAVHLVRMK